MAASIGNNCVKQLTLIRKDLEALSNSSFTTTAALKGQITTSLNHLSENLASYEQLTKTEPNTQKQEKQQTRLRDLRSQYEDLKSQHQTVLRRLDAEFQATSRNELLGRRGHHNATPENPYASQAPSMTRSEGNQKEAGKLSRVSGVLDEYIESGLASLGDLRDQNSTLKGTQRRLRDVAVGLGISGDTIRMVERRVKSDKYVFYGGCIITLVCFVLILRYFG